MLYISEQIFVDKFIAFMRLADIESFPFDTKEFYDGIERMNQFFINNRSQFGDDADEISRLFIKDSNEGVYSRFRNAIDFQNGKLVKFENPEYVKGLVKVSRKDAEKTINKEHISVSNEYMNEITDAFCKGAGLI